MQRFFEHLAETTTNGAARERAVDKLERYNSAKNGFLQGFYNTNQ